MALVEDNPRLEDVEVVDRRSLVGGPQRDPRTARRGQLRLVHGTQAERAADCAARGAVSAAAAAFGGVPDQQQPAVVRELLDEIRAPRLARRHKPRRASLSRFRGAQQRHL